MGDRGTDVLAGRAVGCETFLVGGFAPRARDEEPDHIVANLAEAAARILTREGWTGAAGTRP